MSVEFVGFRPWSEVFSPDSTIFVPPPKPSTFLNCNSIWKLQIPINFY